MRILIVPDSFKESLSATEVSFSIKEGIVSILPEAKVEELPFSDGGEGAIEVLDKHTEGTLVTCPTENALGEAIEASYFLFGKKKKAWIELSQASGLAQIPANQRNVLKATTYGTGLLIKDALAKGCTEIILGVGGSATNDGGAGIYEALGGYFLDEKDRPIERGGAALCSLKSLIPPQISEKINWNVACDVNNPLLGNTGAATVYAPQKGATQEDVKLLEQSMSQLAKVLEQHFNRSVTTLKGGGAAG
ncbi:MAG: glycerate kinase [Flavobacteriaceae bacterium]|nr:glycerate kinase [Flavobacteriaceae bacterium]